jgi:hypothetical protein
MDQAIRKVGGIGKFQFMAYYVTIMNFIVEGMAVYSLAFLTRKPIFEC